MVKATIELFKVTKSFKVKFSLIVKNDETQQNQFQKLVNKFILDGNEYLKITPYPFLTVDITSKMDKNEEWSSNRMFNMNRKEVFMMCQRLRRLISRYTTVKNLFFYDNDGKLKVNPQEAEKIKEVLICGQKAVVLYPCVVENEEDHNLYEGCFLFINSVDYFTYMTYFEMQYFLFELERIDMSSLSIQIINAVNLLSEVEKQQIMKKKPIQEEIETEIEDKKVRIKIEEPHEIPNI